MLEIQCKPFCPSDIESATATEDGSFRYRPNIVCPACRELLDLGLALQKELGRKMAEEVHTKFNFGDLVNSAELGCHLCALFKTAMLGVSSDQLVPAPSWHVAYSMQRAFRDDALYQITLLCNGLQKEWSGSIRRGYLQVYPRARADTKDIGIDALDVSKVSLGRSTDDKETFGVAKTWLNKCLSEHRLCAENDDEARVVRPARLLYIGDTIKLVDSIEAQGREYITLSHCWGKQTYVPRLLFGTETDLRKGVGIDYLPKTFQDAVLITRKLGYEFIWIDSLCIIQDSPDDWQVQAKIMALVYVNSALTIAALKSPGSSGGCFTSERNPLGLRPLMLQELDIEVESSISSELWDAEVNTSGYGASPLHTRSWVVQERMSSPRTLLYGAYGVYWECRCAQASESHYRQVAWDDKNNKKTWLQKLEAVWTDLPRETALYRSVWMEHWIDLVKTYSSCELTVKTDKIIAVTGLISEIERRSKLHKRCILGLWADDLPGMLLWYRSRNDMNSPTDEIGRLENDMPTWTWASVEGRCSYLPAAGIIEWQVTAELDKTSHPVSLEIDTWRREVFVDEDDALTFDPSDSFADSFAWFPDCGMPGPQQNLHVVLIQRARVVDKPPIWAARCLVLTSAPYVSSSTPAVPVLTRVGVVTIRFSDTNDDPFRSKRLAVRETLVLQ